MKPEITNISQQAPGANADDFEALLWGAAFKTQCGYRVLKMWRERERNGRNKTKNT